MNAVCWLTGDIRGGHLGGSAYVRCALPAQALRRQGYATAVLQDLEVDPTGWICPMDRSGKAHFGFDTLIFHRSAAATAIPIIRAARECGQRILVDCDDWPFGIRPSNAAWDTWHKQEWAPGEGLKWYLATMAAADGIVCSTPYLAYRLRERVPVAVHVARNMCKLSDWQAHPVRERPPVYGWVGTTDFRNGDLEILRGVLAPFLRRHDLAFYHGGDKPGTPHVADVLELEGCKVVTAGAVPITRYRDLFREIDVGLAPLSDLPFNRAKSWLKALEYGCAGIPCIASLMDEYEAWGGAALAHRPSDWVRQLERSLEPSWRMAQRERAREAAEACDISRMWPEWEHALTGSVTRDTTSV